MPLASVTPTVTPEPVQGDDPSTTTTVPTPTDETAADPSDTPTPESLALRGGWLAANPASAPQSVERQLPWNPITWLRWLLARMGMVEQNVLAQVGAR
jgi:hypothetical protein